MEMDRHGNTRVFLRKDRLPRALFRKVFYGGLTFQIGFFFKKENLLWGKDFLFMSESDCSSNMLDILSLIYLMFAVMFSMF